MQIRILSDGSPSAGEMRCVEVSSTTHEEAAELFKLLTEVRLELSVERLQELLSHAMSMVIGFK
jgi:hypothetical protein